MGRGRTAGGALCGERRTDFRSPAAAILNEEGGQSAYGGETGTVDDGTALALRLDQPGARQHGEMGGHGVMRHGGPPRDLARRQALGFVRDQQPEHVETRRLGEGGKSQQGLFLFHMSTLVDITTKGKCGRHRTSPIASAGGRPCGLSERRKQIVRLSFGGHHNAFRASQIDITVAG